MFDFFRKRSAKPSTPPEPPKPVPVLTESVTQSQKQAAMEQAAGFSENEAAAVEFILQCNFADARLKAAEFVHSKAAIEQVLQAMRNTDRRVAKFMQARLDTLKLQEQKLEQVRKCVEQAQRLVMEPLLTPSQVAELDNNWKKIGDVPSAMQQEFLVSREQLRARLAAQTALQRAMLDLQSKLKALANDESLAVGEVEKQLVELEHQAVSCNRSDEAASLPKNLLADFAASAAGIRQALQVRQRDHLALQVREQLLAQWEGDEAHVTPEAIRRQWKDSPMPNDPAAISHLQERFDALLRRIVATTAVEITPKPQKAPKNTPSKPDARFVEALTALENALAEGALLAAAEQDKVLRAKDLVQASLPADMKARLLKARAELARLQGWAKWGGHVSREELLAAAQALPQQSLPVAELARKVGSLRERWKSLDATAGPASKELWQSFDEACTTAYAPAALHYKQLSEERQQHAQQAQELLAEVQGFAASLQNQLDGNPSSIDWKAVSGFIERTQQQWRRIGTIDRKDRKRLDAEFSSAFTRLTGPLATQRQKEAGIREQLIEEAERINPHERSALDSLRSLQDRWQQHAKALPLERKREQELWERFRQACDRIFASRKEVALAADADRQAHLQEKQAICLRLEAATQTDEKSIRALLRDAADEWRAIGAVPRSEEEKMSKRYQHALEVLNQRLQTAKDAILVTLIRKLLLCLRIEKGFAMQARLSQEEYSQLQIEWEALPVLPESYENLLRKRLDTAASALLEGEFAERAMLEKNSEILLREILRLEILNGKESPVEWARERLKMQVEVLQSSLKVREKPVSGRDLEQYMQLCRLPALADSASLERIARLL